MNKFLFSAILEEVYREILYLTYNYQKEMIGDSEVNKFNNTDFTNLKKSKILSKISDDLEFVKLDEGFYFDQEFVRILKEKDYTDKTCHYLIRYLNPYVEYYINEMHKRIDQVALVLDSKYKSDGYKGEYPLYLKVEEKKCIIYRAVLSTTAGQYLSRESNKFGLKLTYMEYDVPLKDYKFSKIDLREKEKDEIIKLMDSSIKVDLNHCKYYDTTILEVETDKDELKKYSDAEISLWASKKELSYGGVKSMLKSSLKRTLFSLLILVFITVLILVMKYFIK